MPGLYYLCFIILVKVSFARFILQELASQDLSGKVSKSPSKSTGENGQHSRKSRSSALSPLFEVKSDVSFADGGFKAVLSFLPSKECTCEDNHICVGQDDNNNLVSRCVIGKQCSENTCRNGGTCVQSDSTTTCHCSPGFHGKDCSEGYGNVPYSLNFKVSPSDRVLKKGKSHVEECMVDVPPEEDVQYEWTFNGEKVEAYSNVTGFGKHPGGVLQIDNITDQMKGQYSCTATTSSGRAKHTFEYRVFENCDVNIFPGPEAQSQIINEDVLIPCNAGSRAKVSWKKDGVYIDYEKNPRLKEVVNKFLVITDLEISDAGTYTCEAEDDNGCYSYKEGYLTVRNVRPLKERNRDNSKCDSSIIGEDDSRIIKNDAEGKECLYKIQAPADQVIELNLKMLDFGSASCDEESIVVYEGLSTQGELLGTICSDHVHGILPYHVRAVMIEYRNPLLQEGERFMIEYSFVEDNFTPAPVLPTTPSPVGGNNDCSGMYKGSNLENGEMTYTAPEYQNNKLCIVVVRNDILPGHVVQAEFMYFDTEDSENCMSDSLNIKSGERADSAELGGPYCGESLHGRTLLTSGNSLRLEFKTDDSIALRAFKVRMSFVPTSDCTCERNQICIRQEYEKKCIRGQHCTANACQNGGTCVKTGSTQTCYCRAGFQGEDCSQSDGELSYHLHFTIAPEDRALKRDAGHIEECAVENPYRENVQYDWTFNGAFITAYNRKSGFGVHPGGVLEIDHFDERLEGRYSCFATTSAGTAEHTFEYRLVEDCEATIFLGPQSETKKTNENALFICRVHLRAKEVRWKKDGVYIDFENNPRFRKVGRTYLAISEVKMSDAGMYQCEAEDYDGCFSYKEGRLTVVDVAQKSKLCGVSIHDQVEMARSRISKGYDAKPNGNPWHVTFRSTGDASKQIAFCGGTVISQSYILTAAHCIEKFPKVFDVPFAPNNVIFLLGTTSCLGSGDSVTTRTFKRYTVHPKYGENTTYDNDIAVIELDRPVEYNDAIRPICLETELYNDNVFLENSASLSPIPGKVAGCGQKRNRDGPVAFLQELHLPYVNNKNCEESLRSRSHLLTDKMFCAGSNIGMTGDTCGGDGGGGLVMATSTKWVQTGIFSWGLGCDADRYYSYYTNVGKFYDWIDSVTKFSEEEVPDFLN